MGKKDKIRRGRSPQEWEALFVEQLDSGLTQVAFCRSRGLSVGAFYNAKGRAKAAQNGVEQCCKGEFVAVALAPEPSGSPEASWDVELILGRAWYCGYARRDVDAQLLDARVAVSAPDRYAQVL